MEGPTDTGHQSPPHPQEPPVASAGVGGERAADQIEYCICRKLEAIEDQETSPSDQHSPFSKSSPFDQLIYMEMLKFNHRLEKAKRADAIRSTLSKKKNQPKIRTKISDKDVRRQILQKFGELDVKSPKYAMLFRSFKETMQQELASFEAAEKEALISGNTSLTGLETVDDVRKEMGEWVIKNQVDVEMYTNFDPRSNKSKAEWLNLPRPMEKWGRSYLEAKVTSIIHLNLQTKPDTTVKEKEQDDVASTPSTPAGNDLVPPERDILEESLLVLQNPNCDPQRKEKFLSINLAVLDPKYWGFPEYVSNRNEGPEEYYTPLELCYELNKLIHQCPLGTSVHAFSDLFYRTHGYHLSVNIGQRNTTTNEVDIGTRNEELFASLTDIFYAARPIDGVGRTLLFPAAYKGLIASRRIHDTKLTHFMLMAVILNGTGFANVENLPSLVLSSFGFNINPFMFGYLSIFDFVKDYMSPLRNYVTFVEYSHKQDTAPVTYAPTRFLVLTNFPNAIQKFEAYRAQNEDPVMAELEKSRIKSLTLVEKHQAQMKRFKPIMRKLEEIEFTSDCINYQGLHYCRCYYAISPSNFYLILLQDFANLQYLMAKLEDESICKMDLPFNFLEEITIGSLVLTKIKPEKNTWCRAVVISLPCVNEDNPESGIGVKIRQLDYGGLFWVKLDEISPLPKELGVIRALAIHCSLQFENKILHKKELMASWTDKESEMFIDMICGKNMKVRLSEPVLEWMMTPVGNETTTVMDPYGNIIQDFPARENINLPLPDAKLFTVINATVLETKQQPTNDYMDSMDDFKTSEVVVSDLAVEFEKWYENMKKEEADNNEISADKAKY